MPKASLTSKGVYQHGQSVVCLAHIRGVDLARVACEYHFGALTDASKNRFESRWFEVLGLVNHNELLLQ